MALSEARRRGFSSGTPVSSPFHLLMVSSNKSTAKINAISTLSNLVAERAVLSYQVAHCMLHVIGARCVARD